VDQETSQLIDSVQKAPFETSVPACQRREAGTKTPNGRRFFVEHANQVLSDAEQVLNLIPAVSSDDAESSIHTAVALGMNEAHMVLVGTDMVLSEGSLLAIVGTYNLFVCASRTLR
jgi:hypothetical protein